MGALILRRIALALLALVLISLVVFASVELLPGDFADVILGQSATPEAVAALRQGLGLDEPAVGRYLGWVSGALQGDFGQSLASGRAVSELIGGRLVNTGFLAAYAAIVAVPLSVTLGAVAALYQSSFADRVINILSLGFISLPEFFVGYVLILVFAVNLGVLPSLALLTPEMSFGEMLVRTLLPAMTLVMVVTGHMMRMTRTALVDILSRPYIEMAELKGVGRARIVFWHALPNAVGPIANVIAINLAYLVVGVVVVEVVFVYPGIGQLFVDSVSSRDLPVVQACCLIFASVYIILNLLADVAQLLSNPRLRQPK